MHDRRPPRPRWQPTPSPPRAVQVPQSRPTAPGPGPPTGRSGRRSRRAPRGRRAGPGGAHRAPPARTSRRRGGRAPIRSKSGGRQPVVTPARARRVEWEGGLRRVGRAGAPGSGPWRGRAPSHASSARHHAPGPPGSRTPPPPGRREARHRPCAAQRDVASMLPNGCRRGRSAAWRSAPRHARERARAGGGSK